MQSTNGQSRNERQERDTESPRQGGLCQIGEALCELLSLYALEIDVEEGAPWSDADGTLAAGTLSGELAYSTSRA
ncbi:MAG TPA: hypothetical protein VFI31_05770 [Pirellulales bacterium]|nr:hypothetical protein [Pirellulales bacterium]